MDVTLKEMQEMPAGSVVGIACHNCEGHEDHTKQQDVTWKCNWCGDVKDIKE